MSSMNTGGAETFLMKQYRRMDKEKYQMDFCVNVAERGFYDDEIEALGGRIYRIPSKSQDFRKSLKALEEIVRDNGYANVLCSSVKPGTALELVAAKKVLSAAAMTYVAALATSLLTLLRLLLLAGGGRRRD